MHFTKAIDIWFFPQSFLFIELFSEAKYLLSLQTSKNKLVLLINFPVSWISQLSCPGFEQAWKVLEYTGLSWKVLENKICLEKYLKNTQRPWKVLEYYYLQEDSTLFFGGLNQYKIEVPLFGAAYATPNQGTNILHWFSKTNIISNGL